MIQNTHELNSIFLDRQQSPCMKCMAGLYLITEVASIVIIVLSALGIYGPVGSTGFFASTAVGYTIAITYLAIGLGYALYRPARQKKEIPSSGTPEYHEDKDANFPFALLHSYEAVSNDSEELIMANEKIDLAINSINKPKPAEKEKYDQLRKQPLQLTEKGKQFIKNLGFGSSIDIAPNFDKDNGECHGACLFFLMDYYKHRNLNATIKKFQGGVPIEGAIIQQVYEALNSGGFARSRIFMSHLYIIFRYSYAFYEEDSDLTDTELHVLEAARAVIEEIKCQDGKPENENLVERIETWIKNKYPEESIAKHIHCLLNHFNLRVKSREWEKRPDGFSNESMLFVDLLLFNLCGMEVESVPICNGSPKEILNQIRTLPTGEYLLERPYFKFEKGLIGRHSLTFIITEEKNVYFYEPNEGVYISKDLEKFWCHVATNYYMNLEYAAYLQMSESPLINAAKNVYINWHPKLGSFLFKIKDLKNEPT